MFYRGLLKAALCPTHLGSTKSLQLKLLFTEHPLRARHSAGSSPRVSSLCPRCTQMTQVPYFTVEEAPKVLPTQGSTYSFHRKSWRLPSHTLDCLPPSWSLGSPSPTSAGAQKHWVASLLTPFPPQLAESW